MPRYCSAILSLGVALLMGTPPLLAQPSSGFDLQMGPNESRSGLSGSLKVLGREVQQILWNLQRDEAGQYSMKVDVQDPSSPLPQTFEAILQLGNLLQLGDAEDSAESLLPSGRLQGEVDANQFNLRWAPEASAEPQPLLNLKIQSLPSDSR